MISFRSARLKLGIFAAAAAVALVPSVASAQVTPATEIDAAQTAMGFEGAALMSAAITEYGPIMLTGIGFLVAVGLVWSVFRFFRSGAR